MNEKYDTISDALHKILDVYTQYLLEFEDLLLKEKGDRPWFWRVEDIYYKEAPITATKLILALHLTDKYQLTFPVANPDNIISVFTTNWSLNAERSIWQQALAVYGSEDEAQRLVSQLASLSIEIQRALENIR